MTDYYKLLGASMDASVEVLKKKHFDLYRNLRSKANSATSAERAKIQLTLEELEDAEKILFDPVAKRRYDRELAEQQLPVPPPEPKKVERTQAPPARVDPAPSVTDLLAKAEKFEKAGDMQSAVNTALHVTQIDGGNATGWATLARLHGHVGRFDEAFYEFKRAITISPFDAMIRFEYGMALNFARHLDEAWNESLEAKRLGPSLPWGWWLAGTVQATRGDFGSAVEEFSGARDRWPGLDRSQPVNMITWCQFVLMEERWVEVSGVRGLPDGRYPIDAKVLKDARELVMITHVADSLLNQDNQQRLRNLESWISFSTRKASVFNVRIAMWALVAWFVLSRIASLLPFSGVFGVLLFLWFIGGLVFYTFTSRQPLWKKRCEKEAPTTGVAAATYGVIIPLTAFVNMVDAGA